MIWVCSLKIDKKEFKWNELRVEEEVEKKWVGDFSEILNIMGMHWLFLPGRSRDLTIFGREPIESFGEQTKSRWVGSADQNLQLRQVSRLS